MSDELYGLALILFRSYSRCTLYLFRIANWDNMSGNWSEKGCRFHRGYCIAYGSSLSTKNPKFRSKAQYLKKIDTFAPSVKPLYFQLR